MLHVTSPILQIRRADVGLSSTVSLQPPDSTLSEVERGQLLSPGFGLGIGVRNVPSTCFSSALMISCA